MTQRCECNFAFMVDGILIHCSGIHVESRRHQLPQLTLTAGSLIETYGRTSQPCINCRGGNHGDG